MKILLIGILVLGLLACLSMAIDGTWFVTSVNF